MRLGRTDGSCSMKPAVSMRSTAWGEKRGRGRLQPVVDVTDVGVLSDLAVGLDQVGPGIELVGHPMDRQAHAIREVQNGPVGTSVALVAGHVTGMGVQDAVGEGLADPRPDECRPVHRDRQVAAGGKPRAQVGLQSAAAEVRHAERLCQACELLLAGGVVAFALARLYEGDLVSALDQFLDGPKEKTGSAYDSDAHL
jgi:hypothetical protein